jgi:hypothetical protein
MDSRPWFDAKTGALLFDEMVAERASYRKIVEDETVTPEELREQAQTVADLLRRLEGMLTPEAKAVASDALCELAVLNALVGRMRLTATGQE